MSDQISLDELVAMAEAGNLRIRAFGETHMFGSGPAKLTRLTPRAFLTGALSEGLMVLYRDKDGLFLGPPSPQLVELTMEQADTIEHACLEVANVTVH
jgi:hypothetical protein